jgi:hypothetical protein
VVHLVADFGGKEQRGRREQGGKQASHGRGLHIVTRSGTGFTLSFAVYQGIRMKKAK